MNAVATKPVDGVTIEQHRIPGGGDVFVYVPEQGRAPVGAPTGKVLAAASYLGPEHGHESLQPSRARPGHHGGECPLPPRSGSTRSRSHG